MADIEKLDLSMAGERCDDAVLPCPFCGGNDIQIDEMESFWDKNETSWRVLCIDCIAETAGDTKEQAIAAWNRRADARQHALKTGVCPMCEDCPDGCPIETPKDSRNIITNADRIRSMGDEELHKFLLDFEAGDIDYAKTFCDLCCKDAALERKSTDCKGCLLWWLKNDATLPQGINWLQQPAETAGDTKEQAIAAWNSRTQPENNPCADCSGIVYRQTNSGKIIPANQRCAAKITPPCYQPDGDGCAYQIYGDNDDEPINQCKACPLCYSDKVRHKQPENKPLTLDELRQMDGEPVYIVDEDLWGIIKCDLVGRWAGMPFAVGHYSGVNFEWDIKKRGLVCCRSKPKEE